MYHLKSPCRIYHTKDFFGSFESPLGPFAIWIDLILWQVDAPNYELAVSLYTSLVLSSHTGFSSIQPFARELNLSQPRSFKLLTQTEEAAATH